jgi:disulfide bond formation protein DsbB
MRCALLNHPVCRTLFSVRGLFLWMAATSTALILFALYLQHFLGEHPCPLCITQRIFVMLIGVLALMAAVHNPAQLGRRVWSALIVLAAIGGGIVAGRHVWIQHLPDEQVPVCGPDIVYMFQNFPLQKAIHLLFNGDGNCHEIGWTFLTLSIPEWMLMAFAGFAVAAAVQWMRRG